MFVEGSKNGILGSVDVGKITVSEQKDTFFEVRLKIDRVLNFSSDTVNETRVRRDRHIAHKFL